MAMAPIRKYTAVDGMRRIRPPGSRYEHPWSCNPGRAATSACVKRTPSTGASANTSSPANTNEGLTKPEFGALDIRKANPEKINYVKMEKIARLVHQTSWDIANADSRPKP